MTVEFLKYVYIQSYQVMWYFIYIDTFFGLKFVPVSD